VARSRAAQRLDEAPTSPCPGCGRDTKTVQGVCAECWYPKEDGAVTIAPTPRTERLGVFDVDWDEPVVFAGVALAVTTLAGVILKVVLW
jgi:hypothetical protein